MMVKGTWVVNYVKIIRANKDMDWGKWLKPEDWEIINGDVWSGLWYPFDSWQRMGDAVYHEIAKANVDLVRSFGRFMLKDLLKTYEDSFVVSGNPAESVEKYVVLMNRFFKDIESATWVNDRGSNHIIVNWRSSAREREYESVDAYPFQLAGNLEELVEAAGGKDLDVNIAKKSEELHEIRITWK